MEQEKDVISCFGGNLGLARRGHDKGDLKDTDPPATEGQSGTNLNCHRAIGRA